MTAFMGPPGRIEQPELKRARPAMKPRCYGWVIDLDERGIFRAHLENESGRTLFSLDNESSPDGAVDLVTDGFLRHGRDTEGLREYLVGIECLPATAVVLDGIAWWSHLQALTRETSEALASVSLDVSYAGPARSAEAMPWEQWLPQARDVVVNEVSSVVRHGGLVRWTARLAVRFELPNLKDLRPDAGAEDIELWRGLALDDPRLLRGDLDLALRGTGVRCTAVRALAPVQMPPAPEPVRQATRWS